ncbi:MAG: hypothetical protein GSR85_12030 [Desulfurococcales archaeon]|nr:hypothetical protein [Desulfurococcales archaeon]
MNLVGDPKKLAKEIVDREYSNVTPVIDEAYKAAEKLLEDAYEKALRDALKRIDLEYQRMMERLSSKRSSLDLELKNKVAGTKSRFIDEVINKAMEELVAGKGEEWYERYLKRVIGTIAKEADSVNGKMILKTSRDDIERVKSLVKEMNLGNLIVSSDPIDIMGGVVAESEDGSLRLDYSLDLMVKLGESRIRSIASRVLFGE